MILGLNYWLNKVSMYRLTSILLTVIWIVALGLAALGILSYAPDSLFVSSVVLVSSSIITNYLIGKVVRISTHAESAYITGLILFFLFSPSTSPEMLLAYVLLGILASVSKYLLVLHGRHIFNPAAVSATVISLLGLASATWWIATPVLAPLTLLSAVLVLKKTRRLAMAAIFLTVSIPLVYIILIGYGTSFLESFTLLLTWPFLFFVGFMLSEPLTLPAKNWQQYVEAAFVGFFFAVPMGIGSFTLTPMIALLLGNIIAYIFTRRKRIKLTFVRAEAQTSQSKEFSFEIDKSIKFKPGQYIEITIPHKGKDSRGMRRSFSITSQPHQSLLKLGVKFHNPSSSFKKAMSILKPGTVIYATGVNGDFTLPKDINTPLLFIAGGIGITPFISHLRYMQQMGQVRDVIVLYAVKDLDDLAYVKVLRDSNIKVIVATKSSGPLQYNNWISINKSYVTYKELIQYIPDIASRTTYVSGAPSMVSNMRKHLKSLHVKHIKTDYFTGY